MIIETWCQIIKILSQYEQNQLSNKIIIFYKINKIVIIQYNDKTTDNTIHVKCQMSAFFINIEYILEC